MKEEVFYKMYEDIVLKDLSRQAEVFLFMKYLERDIRAKVIEYEFFANKIKQVRIEKGYSAEEVAKEINVEVIEYIKFERAKRRFNAKVVLAIMDFLKVDLSELTGGENQNKKIEKLAFEITSVKKENQEKDKEKDIKIEELQKSREEDKQELNDLKETQKEIKEVILAENKILKEENQNLKARLEALESSKK